MISQSEKKAFQIELWNAAKAAIDIYYLCIHQPCCISSFSTWAFNTLRQTVQDLNDIQTDWEYVDISQQFLMYFFEADANYALNKPSVSYKSYVTRRTIWGMRDWFVKRSQIINKYPYYYFVEEKPELILNLDFLLYGTRLYPFSELSPYERYLIFLRFREEKSILKISHIVQHERKIIKAQLDSILDKLRRLANESKNTRGSREGRDGS